MISAVIVDIDNRINSMLALNTSLKTTHAQIDDNMAAQRNTTESDQYIESYNTLRSFVRNVMYYVSADDQAQKSSIINKGLDNDHSFILSPLYRPSISFNHLANKILDYLVSSLSHLILSHNLYYRFQFSVVTQ